MYGSPCTASYRGFHVEYTFADDTLGWAAWKEKYLEKLEVLISALTMKGGYFIIDKIEIQREDIVILHRRGQGAYIFLLEMVPTPKTE